MTKYLIGFFLLTMVLPIASAQTTLNVISYNIRLNTPSDELNGWPYRKEAVMDQLKMYQADIFGVQEALIDQMNDLRKGMPEYQSVGAGRDDGKEKGEFSAIFFLKSRFELLDGGTFWLSETPEIPSKGWDAALNRVCSWAELKDKATGQCFCVFNTHFDHIGVKARAESANLILQKINELALKDKRVILTGGFNLTPDELPFQLIVKQMSDSRQVSKAKPTGTDGTFNGFKPDVIPTERIDYIFVNQIVDVAEYHVLNDLKADGRVISDHFPVLTKLILKNH